MLSKDEISVENLNQANEFFTAMGTRVASRIAYEDSDDLSPHYEVENILRCSPEPTELRIESTIKSLRNNCAPGANGFTASTLKRNIDFFSPILTHLTSLICRSGRYPDLLKKAITILIHKKGDTEELGNYRPISLLSVFNKVVEKYLANEISWQLERNKILADAQFPKKT